MVRGLQTFVKKFVQNGYFEVSIVDEIRKYSNDKKQSPILVFDLAQLIRLMCEEEKDTLFGGRWKIYADRLDKLFKKLKDAGAELVFFEDGLIETEKYVTWVQRQNKKYSEHSEVINYVNMNHGVSEIVSTFKDKLRGFSTLMTIIEEMAKKHGKLIFSVHQECDIEIARYADKHNVLAVVSDDMDFVIFKGKWKLFSVDALNLDNLHTREYNRVAFKATLGLNDDQLAALSTIGGNDIIRFEEVENALGQFFRHTPKIKFPNIAKYIKTELSVNDDEKARKIASKIIGNTRPETLARIKKSLNCYDFDFEEKEFSPLLKFCLDHNSIASFKILNRFPKNFTLVYFDLRKTDIPIYHDVAVPLFKRQLGVFFYTEKNKTPEMTFEIYSRNSHYGSFEKSVVSPVYPDVQVPALIELMDHKYSEHDDDRYTLLKWMIGYKSEKNLKDIPKTYFLDIVTIIMMKDLKVITTDEADIFLYTFKNVVEDKISKTLEYPRILNERAFRLAFVFEKIRECVYISLEVVGMKKYASISQFDGVFFHKTYLRYKDEGQKFSNDLGDVSAYRFYE